MKQLTIPTLETWTFSYFRMDGPRVERAYSNGLQTLRLFLTKDGWRDVQNRLWQIIGPAWGQPFCEVESSK